MHNRLEDVRRAIVFALVLFFGGVEVGWSAEPTIAARLGDAGVSAGFVVVVGFDDARTLGELGENERFVVQGLARDPMLVRRARAWLADRNLTGRIGVRVWRGGPLPYVDNLLNAVVVIGTAEIPAAEVLRVLRPYGVALFRTQEGWRQQTKPWPPEIDEWTHYLHDPGNNAVARDRLVGPPEHLQWTARPRWGRHHDHVSSTTALVSARGRIFYIIDEGATASILWPSHWALVARDAFNGKLLWKRRIPEWETRMWPLKSGPAQLPRHLAAVGNRVYATLGLNVPVTALDAETGNTVQVYEATKGAEEILVSDGVLFALVDPEFDMDKYTRRSAVNRPWWTGRPSRITAVRTGDGKVLWQASSPVMPLTLAVDGKHVYFHDGERVVCLDRTSGKERWRSKPIPRVRKVMSFFAPTLVVYDGVVLFAGGEESGMVKSGGGATKADTLTAIHGETGEVLWQAEHLPSGYSSPEDLFVINGAVWCEAVSNPSLPGTVIGRDLRTGKEIARFDADVKTYWFHHRCHRGKATERFIMVSRTGIEFIDPVTKHWTINHWIRGACLYGILPCNGLIYTPPHPCACYSETKLTGFNAVSAVRPTDAQVYAETPDRLEKFSPPPSQASVPAVAPEDWPTFRHDAARSGTASCTVPASGLAVAWTRALGGRLTQPVAAGGRVYVGAVDRRRLYCLAESDGRVLWTFIAGGRIDSPPTVTGDKLVFGCTDGIIYCLRAADGALLWRFRAAPSPVQVLADEQVESVWPLHGSVLVLDGAVYAVAGRSVFLDGGMRWLKLDLETGRKLREVILDRRDPRTGKDLHAYVHWLNMPPGLPDVLSSDGKWIFMRSQRFDLDGNRYEIDPGTDNRFKLAADQSGPGRHLFAAGGFLDDTWFHRLYWMYGRRFVSGWCGYYLSGKVAPAGRILCMDGGRIYGYGRKPKFYRWTTPMEFRLFAAPLNQAKEGKVPAGPSCVHVANSPSLDPTGKPLTVAAWVKPDADHGVVIARGGPINGYALYLKGGKPRFAVTSARKMYEVAAKRRIPRGKWTHLAGVLTPSGELHLYVNSRRQGRTKAALVAKTPIQPTQIGLDAEGPAGNYQSPFGLPGAVDEVRVYHRPLSDAEIARLAAADSALPAADPALVLYFSFDDGKARDLSGKKNHGRIEDARTVDGRIGKALAFAGTGTEGAAGYKVIQTWTRDVPILVRAMVLTGSQQGRSILFIAGPRDVMDEEKTVSRLVAGDPEARKLAAEQESEFYGKRGALLWAVSAADGKRLAEYRIPTVPTWDGLIAAGGRLYMTLADGTVRCLAPAAR